MSERFFLKSLWWWPPLKNFDWLKSTFLVGGTVRDLIIGREAVDLDLLVPELTEKKAFELANRFKTSFFKLGRENYVYRIVTSEGKIDLIPLTTPTLEEEAKRRDFTVNSLFLPLSSVREGEFLKEDIIDFLGGLRDLRKKTLRLCQPDSFRKDPVRLLRAVRFCLELGLSLDESTAHRLAEDKRFLLKARAERVKTEVLKLFSFEFPEKVVRKLVALSLWAEILSYAGLGFKIGRLEELLRKAFLILRKVEHAFPLYFAQQVEKGVKIKQLFSLFLAFFLSTDEQTQLPSAFGRFRMSKKAIKACQAWLKGVQRDWLSDKKLQAELVVSTGFSFPACLALALIVGQKELSQESFLRFKKMYEIEVGSFYPFSARQVIVETGLTPSFRLGEEIRKRKIIFLSGILNEQ